MQYRAHQDPESHIFGIVRLHFFAAQLQNTVGKEFNSTFAVGGLTAFAVELTFEYKIQPPPVCFAKL